MKARDVINLFNNCFGKEYSVKLQGDASEPLYIPGDPSVIYFRDDYVSSALHEVAHWCLAGKSRRLKEDYGYWYQGDRDEDAQRAFEEAETVPQALEWIFSEAAGVPFEVSIDNFTDELVNRPAFTSSVREQVSVMLCKGLPERAGRFAEALSIASGIRHYLSEANYIPDQRGRA